ncbi:MAG: chaperonin GroEL [Planctomycetota bacterium]|nr:chaperonin GroEL [Planctomycetota bacterium]MCB9901703.1 chaperonin GroEL [Planctomycetota bacterium]
MAKQYLYDAEARQRIAAGVRKLADAVRVTLGPAGRNVIAQKSFGGPVVTKDGVTVAKEVSLEDPFENMGAKLVTEAAQKTNDVAGDGTTSATVLADAILREGLKAVSSGAEPIALKRGIDKAVATVVENIAGIAKKVTTREQKAAVATISANHDVEIGNLLADAVEKVGPDGVITVEEGKSTETVLDFVDGMQFDKGFLSPYFITDTKNLSCVLEDAYVLLYEKKLSNLRELIPALEAVAHGGRSLLIVAEDIEGEVLAALVVNRLRGVLKVCAVKAPGFGDRRKAMLQDMAVLTGGTFVSEDLGLKLENIGVQHLGRCKKVVVTKDTTTISEGAGSKKELTSRIEQIRSQVEQSTSDYDREKLQERLAKLQGGVAVIKVGAPTEAALKEKKYRVEDALNATRAAVEEGIVPGGGTSLIRCLDVLESLRVKGDDEKTGVAIVRRAIEAPLRQLAANAGEEGAVIVDDVRRAGGNKGWDARSGQIVDMVKEGIIDPAKVVRSGLQHAASIAAMILTTETLITDLKDEKSAAAGADL